ncbi:MAG: hypothetical protein QOK07_3216 [Gemmatimonadaceae bacterium]|jgi:hypothetical protein|nr:hypothetical protein [Gemmatimonadaceae bacterium]
MNLPIQASPVNRSTTTAMRAYAAHGVTASGDGCPTGYWCCSNYNGFNTCLPCGTSPCLLGQTTVCQASGLHPYDGC